MLELRKLQANLYRIFINPKSEDPDSRRREFILNVLLSGLCLLAIFSMVSMLIHRLAQSQMLYSDSLIVVPVFVAFVCFLFWLSRKGYARLIAWLLLLSVGFLATYFLFAWSFVLPMTQLLYVLAIVLAGVLFRAQAAFITAAVASTIVLVVAYIQTQGHLSTDTSWLNVELDTADAVGAVAIFIVVGLVTWLANTEIDRSLMRARASETSLAAERDSLEVKVTERTKDLEEAHLVRLMELQRFAELGRLSASLLHDVANPLTTASLNVGRLNIKYEPDLAQQAAQSLQRIERYVEAARKQLLMGGKIEPFSIRKELTQVISILAHKANQNSVKIKVKLPAPVKLIGDPVKFNQLAANLILNAIEAYEDTNVTDKQRIVVINVEPTRYGVSMAINDHGRGLNKKQRTLIFQSFYTTKAKGQHNMGIGLSLVKQIVEVDFDGQISVSSSPKGGTTFKVKLLNRKT